MPQGRPQDYVAIDDEVVMRVVSIKRGKNMESQIQDAKSLPTASEQPAPTAAEQEKQNYQNPSRVA